MLPFSQRVLGRLICCQSLKDATLLSEQFAVVVTSKTHNKVVEDSIKGLLEQFKDTTFNGCN